MEDKVAELDDLKDDGGLETILKKGEQLPQTGPESPQSPNMDSVLKDEMNFIQNVSQFYNQEALSDVVLKIGDQTFFAHKFVLAKSSDVFRTMLYDKNWSHTARDELELSDSVECQVVFDKFLRYLYTAEVSISTMSAVGILCLADKYQVTSLKELCVKYMVENSRSPRFRNALNWYSWSKVLHLKDLICQCAKTIAYNFFEIASSAEWLTMDTEFVSDTLNNSELVVPNEFVLWEALSKWLLHESRVSKLSENSHLLQLIRFPQMLVSQLYQIEQSELSKRKECQEKVQHLLSQAYRFRAFCPNQSQLGTSFSEPFYLPREYTDLTVDSVRMQNTLRFGIQVDVKMYKGPVPSDVRDGDWKITYRKQNDLWSLQLYCHETAMVNQEARIQPSIIVYNDQDQPIQVHHEGPCVLNRGSSFTIQTSIDYPEMARSMSVLIKPVPS